ncbi:MAG: transaldolase family protein [Terracidiphilus sp.]
MIATQELHNLGQSLWLDNITRDLLDNGTLKRYIDELSITGLTSNPTIFEHAISKSKSYDAEIGRLPASGLSGEELFFELALQDLTRAADLFAAVHERTAGNDGFVSLEVSPLLANDTKGSVAAATTLHKRANRPNLFIKIPGTKEGNPAIEEAIASGVAINVTLLFSREHYVASAEAYMRGLERRIATGLSPDVRSVASVFLSRWDGATMDKVPDQLRDKLGIAIGQQTYKAYRDILASDRWQRPTFSILPLLPRQTRSTPYLRRPFWPSPIMANWPELFRAMEETVKLFSPIFERQESIWSSWQLTCNRRAQSPSMNRGKTCSVQSRPRAKSCSTLPESEALARLGAGRF